MHPNTYKIRFLFTHTDLNFTAVRDQLSSVSGIQFGRLMNAGEDRYMFNGKKLEGKYIDSRLGFDFDITDAWLKSEEKDSGAAVEEMLEKLQPHLGLFNELFKNGCDLSVIVAIYVDENTSVKISPNLAKKLSKFSMSLWYDLYPPDVVK